LSGGFAQAVADPHEVGFGSVARSDWRGSRPEDLQV